MKTAKQWAYDTAKELVAEAPPFADGILFVAFAKAMDEARADARRAALEECAKIAWDTRDHFIARLDEKPPTDENHWETSAGVARGIYKRIRALLNSAGSGTP